MLLDIIYTIQQFIHQLPNDLDEFKSLVSCAFPKVLDTKLMGSMLPFKVLKSYCFMMCVYILNFLFFSLKDQLQSTTLGDMYSHLQLPPFRPVEIETPGKYNTGVEEHNNLHEAAYDAFITGLQKLLIVFCSSKITNFFVSF